MVAAAEIICHDFPLHIIVNAAVIFKVQSVANGYAVFAACRIIHKFRLVFFTCKFLAVYVKPVDIQFGN